MGGKQKQKQKQKRRNQGCDDPLVGIDTELEDFVRFVSDTQGATFDDALNCILRIGMRQLSTAMLAEREREMSEGLARPIRQNPAP